MANYVVSPDKKAAALALLKIGAQSDAEIAAGVGVHPRTLQGWRQQADRDPNLANLARQTLAKLMPKYAQLAEGITDKLLEQVAEASYANKASTVLGILTDKLMAAAGMASQVIEHRHTLDLSADAAAALRLYLDEGFSPAEARRLLAEDDPELARHLGAVDGELIEGDEAGEDEQIEQAEPAQGAPGPSDQAPNPAGTTPDATDNPPDESAPPAGHAEDATGQAPPQAHAQRTGSPRLRRSG